MFEFRKIRLEDKERINERLKVSDYRGCEYSFANNLAWQRMNNTEICFEDDFYISCSEDKGQPYVTFPAGVKPEGEGIDKFRQLFEQKAEALGVVLKRKWLDEYCSRIV